MAADGLEFRRLTGRDAGGLAALFAALAANGDERLFHPHPLTADEARRVAERRDADLYYAACVGDAVLAYGLLRGWQAGFAVPSLGIAVHPRQRRSGLARAFMLFLHAAARQRGAPRVRLKVYPENHAARRLYDSLGYVVSGEDDGQLVAVVAL